MSTKKQIKLYGIVILLMWWIMELLKYFGVSPEDLVLVEAIAIAFVFTHAETLIVNEIKEARAQHKEGEN